jgi:hypothetical protein
MRGHHQLFVVLPNGTSLKPQESKRWERSAEFREFREELLPDSRNSLMPGHHPNSLLFNATATARRTIKEVNALGAFRGIPRVPRGAFEGVGHVVISEPFSIY